MADECATVCSKDYLSANSMMRLFRQALFSCLEVSRIIQTYRRNSEKLTKKLSKSAFSRVEVKKMQDAMRIPAYFAIKHKKTSHF